MLVTEPLLQGGFKVSVDLPFGGKGNQITNPMYSPTLANYLRSEWMTKPAYWSRAVADLLEQANDMEIDNSNQMVEAVINNKKNNQGVRNYLDGPAQYAQHRYNDTRESYKQFIDQINGLQHQIKVLEEARIKKKRRLEETFTSDQLTQLEEDQQEEQWSRKGSGVEQDHLLRQEMEAAFTNSLGLLSSRAAQFRYLGKVLGRDVMSLSKFSGWMNNKEKSKKALKKEFRKAFEAFLQEEATKGNASAKILPTDNRTTGSLPGETEYDEGQRGQMESV